MKKITFYVENEKQYNGEMPHDEITDEIIVDDDDYEFSDYLMDNLEGGLTYEIDDNGSYVVTDYDGNFVESYKIVCESYNL